MKVKELIEHLQKLNPELEVYTAQDEEWNGFNKVFTQPVEVIKGEGDWEPQMYDLEWTAAEADMTEEEWEGVKKNLERIVII